MRLAVAILFMLPILCLGQITTAYRPHALYRFNGEVISLEDPHVVDILKKDKRKMFKEVSVYRNRFIKQPSRLFSSTVAHVKIETDRITVHHQNINKYYKREDLPVKPQKEQLNGFGHNEHLCWLYGSRYNVSNIVITDHKLELINQIDLDSIIRKNGLLEYVDHIGHQVVLSNDMRTKTYLVNIVTGKVIEREHRTDAVILDEGQSTIIGFAEINYKRKALIVRLDKKELVIKNDDVARANFIETVVLGDKLIFCSYRNIATGSELSCADLKTGKQIWRADVKQMMAEHSKYRNSVYLSAFEMTIIMEGQESYGSYLQLFDLNTGKRIFDYFPNKK